MTRPNTLDGAICAPHIFFIMTTIQDLIKLDVLNDCTLLCTKQSRWKETTQRYIANMLINNIRLQDEVLAEKYHVQPTIDFEINERGRLRKIEAPVVRDRILQKSLTKYVLLPNVYKYLIYDNYASLKDRGTTFARKRFEVLLRKYIYHNGIDGYILLIDIRKYFENIDHDILKQRMNQRLSNESEEIKNLVNYIIDISSHSNKGVNLGSESPQIFAIDYLTPMDNYVKIVKGIKYYGRYMDDAFVICKTKTELLHLLEGITQILNSLRLKLNEKKTHIVKLTHVFTFLQVKYNILPTGKILKRMSHKKVVRERRRLKAFRRLVDKGEMTAEEAINCYLSWRGSESKNHNACYNTIHEMDMLFKALFPEKIEHVNLKRSDVVKEINKDIEKEDIINCLTFNNNR